MNRYLITASAVILALTPSCHKDKKPSDDIPSIYVTRATTDSVTFHKELPGYIQASSRAEVVGEVSGRLLTQNFTAGQYVNKGQVLFTIESTRYRDAVENASAQLASARSQRDYSRTQTEAMRKAYEQNAVSRMEMLQAENTLRQAESQIREASASLENAKIMLAKCTVRAPISGYITKENVTPGNYVNGEASPQKLATIYDNSTFDAIFSIAGDQYRLLLDAGESNAAFRNMPLKFSEKLPHSYSADLYYESPTVNQSTGTMQLTGKVKNINNELKDGMFVTVSLPYGADPKAILVKDAALSTDQLGKYLYVVNDSDKVVYTPVTVGQIFHDSLRVVTKGIKPGTRYVTQALLSVRAGMKVRPVEVK